jgi:hypothetical protein
MLHGDYNNRQTSFHAVTVHTVYRQSFSETRKNGYFLEELAVCPSLENVLAGLVMASYGNKNLSFKPFEMQLPV